MIFLFKRKKIVLDCFTSNIGAYEYYPIDKLKDNVPNWFRELPNKYYQENDVSMSMPTSTIKSCPGVLEMFKSLATIRLHSDIIINTRPDGFWEYASPNQGDLDIDSHNTQQYGVAFDDYIHLKFNMPWLIKEKLGVRFYFTQDYWNNIQYMQNMHVSSGVVNFKHQNSTNINMFLNRERNTINIEAGQPLVSLIPMSECELVIKNHLVSETEWEQIHKAQVYPSKFIGKYNHRKSLGKCPFGFK